MTHIDTHLDEKDLNVLGAYLNEKCEGFVSTVQVAARELTVTVRRQNIAKFLRYLRDDKQCQFKMLVDITAVDWFGNLNEDRKERFEVVYHLLSIAKNLRIRVKVPLNDGESLESVVSLFSAANWYERETYDMFGIRFENHPDLRRILTDYDFDGHPLRKDFPLIGKVEVYYDKEEKRVAYKPVDMPQDFRHFDDVSAWGGMTGNANLAEEDNNFDLGDFNEEGDANG